ncbi:MAG: simple sugar transport system permease protein [Pseudonocardiales bacterium]|nr:simple sugar transport system permease protein [Pseudonocardiales bacterium]
MASVSPPAPPRPGRHPDAMDRIRPLGPLQRLLRRPDLGAVLGVLVSWGLFALVGGSSFSTADGAASYLADAAGLGILAATVALLMIAGQFDLSVGSMIGAAGMLLAILVVEFGVPGWLAVIVALLFGAGYGALNGWLVVRTKLPSFIVTLAGLFVLRGLTIALTRLITGRTQVGGVDDVDGGGLVNTLFAARIGPFSASVLWWLAITAVCAVVLSQTTFGNWLAATGGNEDAARNSGVPINRVKIVTFMLTGLAAALVGVIQVVEAGSADTLRGQMKEFEAVIAVVIGGTLLTGGYGSVIGAALGALTFGIVRQGIFFTGADTDWFQVVLGVFLMVAVLVNSWLRTRALKAR